MNYDFSYDLTKSQSFAHFLNYFIRTCNIMIIRSIIILLTIIFLMSSSHSSQHSVFSMMPWLYLYLMMRQIDL